MNLTLSILTIIAVLFIVSLTYKFFYKSKQIKKIKNSSSSIVYTYNRSKYSNNSDYSSSSSYSSSNSCSSSDSSSSCSD